MTYLPALVFAACGWLIGAALVFLPWWAWVPIVVSLSPVASHAVQVWLRRPALIDRAEGEIER